MKFVPIIPPRVYSAGIDQKVMIKDTGRLSLLPDEQVTVRTEAGAELDVTRKSWGFYATPSLNGRLPKFGLRAVLVRNKQGRYFVLLIEDGKHEEFQRYIEEQQLDQILWLDDGDALDAHFNLDEDA